MTPAGSESTQASSPSGVEAVPAFADGRHDLGDPGVEGVKFFRLGRVGDERASVAGDACPPDPFDGPGRGDVGQRVAGYEHEVRALTGCGVPAVGEAEHPRRSGGRGVQRLSGRETAAAEQFQLTVQTCAEHGSRVWCVGAGQDRDARVDQAADILLSTGIGRHSLPAPP